MQTDLDTTCINTIRMLSADGVEKAKSGHPGLPMGCAPLAYVLWTRHLKHDPSDPQWPDRDRFVLSAGHGSMLLYSLLHLSGYDLSMDDLQEFRQWGSRTPGHPEFGRTPGVETTTGPLGQGFGNAVGMAVAERFLAARFNRPGHEIVDHWTYVLASDGDLMEGVSHEAASLAGHLRLGRLICLYDDNHVTIDGETDLAYTEDREARFAAYGWHVLRVEDGEDIEALDRAIREAKEEEARPSLIAVRTHIGFGSPHKQDTSSAHGEPLGEEELRLTKERLGWPPEPPFHIPPEALEKFREAEEQGRERREKWLQRMTAYRKDHPDLAAEWDRWIALRIPADLEKEIPVFEPQAKGPATRAASGKVLNAVAGRLPNLIGGSADLSPSNKTLVEGAPVFKAGAYQGRNFHFGVREHAMGAVTNGMALHGGLIPYCGTFLIFSDYMRPAIRMAAMMGLRLIYILTHDSIGLGEDGPTHQPVEHLASLRAVPGLTLIRPADANETAEAWLNALTRSDGPTVLALTRQGLPVLDRSGSSGEVGVHKGAYILKEARDGRPNVILIGTGSEVKIALEAAALVEEAGANPRVVSMPSWELFEAQPEDYRNRVLPPEVAARVVIEAGATQGWCRYAGDKGIVLGIDRFGASAPYQVLYERFGLTPEKAAEAALSLLGRAQGR
ncbi:MAG: transketolase [Desulfobacteraceae bacterium]